MYLGWNFGNALECTVATTTGSVASGETDWGNVAASKAMIDAVNAAGFNAVRIPCARSCCREISILVFKKDFVFNKWKESVP